MAETLTVDVERDPVAAVLDDLRDAATAEDAALTAFIGWLAGLLVERPVRVQIVASLGLYDVSAAGWIAGGDLLLVARHRDAWDDPLGARFLGLLCHETAHERVAEHDDAFRREVERMAGTLAVLCLGRGDEIWRRWEAACGARRAISAGRAISLVSPPDDELEPPWTWSGPDVEPLVSTQESDHGW